MRRFFVEKIPGQGLLSIRGREAKHIGRVLRMAPGDRLILMDGKGSRFLAAVHSVRPDEVVVSVGSALQPPPPTPLRLTLCQALLKSGPMDYVIQKTTELGVAVIVPFTSERTVVRPSGDRLGNKWRRWREIALSASKQSDRDRPPEIAPVCGLEAVLDRYANQDALKIILWEGEQTRDLKELLGKRAPIMTVVGVIGPEGGFSLEEIKAADAAGFVPVSLGRR
ncbi:MAG: 16S rRNA (uracil(1498)-N(3))-methyltransferase, partial [Deltaproteobacteria bacterium]|nr:16S rRNA (uracil(1498)-N(3))-methyltransferase [Deltaproteobacteria bacterium]